MNRANGGNDSCRLALGALVAGIVALQVPAGTPADGFLPSGKFTLGANYWASRNATKKGR